MKLHIFTASYPYGFGESFLNNELPLLSEKFDEIFIYPIDPKGSIQKSYGQQATIVQESFGLGKEITLRDKLFIARIYFIELVHIKQKLFFIRKARLFYAMLKKAVLHAKWLELDKFSEEDGYYSFWMNDWALALAVLNKRGKHVNFVFRVNGFDIWDFRHEGNYLPFRYFVYSQMKKVYSLSKTSRDYLLSFGFFKEKIDYSYYGTRDVGACVDADSDRFVIFSCSSAIPLKRLEKIAKVVCALDFPVKWVHHGSGPTLDATKEIMTKAPSNVVFKNTEKIDDYFKVLEMERELSPNLFINLSTTEGLPVTIMEAMSMGIPILANDVGSCSEFINETTGVLVGPDDSENEIAEVIKGMRMKQWDRKKIRSFWKENFSAEKNYRIFADKLYKDFTD